MRAVLHGDVVAAARCLLACPASERRVLMCRLLVMAEAAARFRRRAGHAHPRFGDGCLQTAAQVFPMKPEPCLDDPEYCACMLDVFESLLDWRENARI